MPGTWREWVKAYEYFGDSNRYAPFDLESDPSESDNLASKNPQQLKTMMQAMIQELEYMQAQYPVEDGRQLKPTIPSVNERKMKTEVGE